MTTWVIISWVAVAILTGVNIFVFLKLKKASESMMKMAFPGAKNMQEAMSQMQNMTKGMNQQMNRAKLGGFASGRKQRGGKGKGSKQQAQLEQAMAMLQQMKGK